MTETERRPDGTRVSDYDYDLGEERIARYPAQDRDGSRLLTLPTAGAIDHKTFSEVVDLFDPGDVLVLNDTKVFPARLVGRKPTGAPAEILLTRPADRGDPYLWEALVRPGGKLKPGRTVLVGDGLEIEVLDSAPGGGRVVRLVTDDDVETALGRHGHIPLPPYLDRLDEESDRDRYQTVYARETGSVAAPTAGLHFTKALLQRIDEAGVAIARITLHVGIGTFRPVEVDDPALHELHHERYVVDETAAAAINGVRADGGRVWAVGTTTVRTLEAIADEDGSIEATTGSTDLFIRPPYDFRAVDCLITNFHLPRSTLLMLVAAFAGYERTMAAYRTAIDEGYRFYSYGDAMALVGR